MEGLNGWLSPDGKFHPCKYGGHGQVAKQLLDRIKNLRHKKYLKNKHEKEPDEHILKEQLYIVMGSKGGEHLNHSYIHISQKPTKKQLKWIHENLEKFDKRQLQILKQHEIYKE
ncbi:hypothetical protein QBE52_11170 [Clostridiaceae bacterium 35-E11]